MMNMSYYVKVVMANSHLMWKRLMIHLMKDLGLCPLMFWLINLEEEKRIWDFVTLHYELPSTKVLVDNDV
jgi:hypothetical protein